MPPSSPSPERVVILGATGSVGTSALDVISSHRDRFQVASLVANTRGKELLEASRLCGAQEIILVDPEAATQLEPEIKAKDARLRTGIDAVLEAVSAPDVDVVVQAITGAAGLAATLAACRAGKRVALANKESFVVAGPLVMAEAHRCGATIIPVDSEHSAIFQCLQAGKTSEVRRIILTASGGPFRGKSSADLNDVTPEEALKHPTWSMGKRITIDSATMMNKALEIVEARWLFDLAPNRIEVVVHPQSVVHSMVEFVDGSVVAQMGPPDMRLPVRYALGWPARLDSRTPRFDWRDYQKLTFETPDFETFPALRLGFEAAERGGTAGAALNAADEVAVARFLNGTLSFHGIVERCEQALHNHEFIANPTLDDLMAVDTWARQEATA